MFHIIRSLVLMVITVVIITTTAFGQPRPPAPSLPADLNKILSDTTKWWMQSSWHFQVYGRPLSQVYDDFNLITDSLEKTLDEVCKSLKIHNAGLIQWYGLPEALDDKGSIAKSYPEFGIVVATYNDTLKNFATIQMNQVLLGKKWGVPKSVFLSVGMAVALEGAYGQGKQRRKVSETIRNLAAQNRIPAITELVKDFRKYPESQSLAVAGSFLGFLLKRFGPAPLKALYTLAGNDNFQKNFEQIYGHPLRDVEQEWLKTIR
jgi:hypothetical protein